MKKVLFIAILLIVTFANAQTKPVSLNNLTETEAKAFADQIASNSQTKWELISAKENVRGDYYNVKYINAALPKETKDGVRNGDSCDDCLRVTFVMYKTDGVFKFYEVWGKYSDLFPTWKQIFRPDADAAKTANDLNSQELINKPEHINFKFKNGGNVWQIINWS